MYVIVMLVITINPMNVMTRPKALILGSPVISSVKGKDGLFGAPTTTVKSLETAATTRRSERPATNANGIMPINARLR